MAPRASVSKEHFLQFKKDHPRWYYVPPENLSACARFFEVIKRPFIYTKFYLVRLFDVFGWRFLVFLSSVYFFNKGALNVLVLGTNLPYFINFMKVDVQTYQILGIVILIPWSLKPFMGLVSDIVPLFGYFKRWWLFLFALVGGSAMLVLGLVDFSANLAGLVAVIEALVMSEISVVDLLAEGRYAALMVKHPETSTDVVSWVWFNHHLGGLLATWVVGPMGDLFKTTGNSWYLKGIFLVGAPMAVQVTIPVLLNWLQETRLPPNERGIQLLKWQRHKDIFTLALIMGFGALGLAGVGLVSDTYWRHDLAIVGPYFTQVPVFAYALIMCGLVATCAFTLLPTSIAKPSLFLMLSSLSYVEFSVMDIFFTSGAGCVPNGPAFSLSYFTTICGTIQSIMGFVGVWLFQALMSEWEFRSVFRVGIILQCLGATMDIIIVKRWNLSVGISDKVFYMIGYNIIFEVIHMLYFMPSSVLISKLCPKGMEATLYALLAGFQNLGKAVSSSIGAFFISSFGVKMSQDGPCDYHNLPIMIAIGHVIMPLCIVLPATFFLIPKGCMTDPICREEFHSQFDPDRSSGQELEGEVNVVESVPMLGKEKSSSPGKNKLQFAEV